MANANPTINELQGVARDVQAVLSVLREQDIEQLVEAASGIQSLGEELKEGKSNALSPYAIGSAVAALGRHVEEMSHGMLRCLLELERRLREQTKAEEQEPLSGWDPSTIYYLAQSDDPKELELAIAGLQGRASRLKRLQEAAQ